MRYQIQSEIMVTPAAIRRLQEHVIRLSSQNRKLRDQLSFKDIEIDFKDEEIQKLYTKLEQLDSED